MMGNTANRRPRDGPRELSVVSVLAPLVQRDTCGAGSEQVSPRWLGGGLHVEPVVAVGGDLDRCRAVLRRDRRGPPERSRSVAVSTRAGSKLCRPGRVPISSPQKSVGAPGIANMRLY